MGLLTRTALFRTSFDFYRRHLKLSSLKKALCWMIFELCGIFTSLCIGLWKNAQEFRTRQVSLTPRQL